jgi:hypothetical protein
VAGAIAGPGGGSAVSPGRAALEGRAGIRPTAWLERAVPPVLEPGQVLPLGLYRLPLGPVGSSEESPPDWSI